MQQDVKRNERRVREIERVARRGEGNDRAGANVISMRRNTPK
jgi:hypothetical protein